MGIGFYIALWGAKLSKQLIKLTKFNGTNFPGELALKICPDFLAQIRKPKNIIAITGTNGKTTVANMVSDMLIAEGKSVFDNRLGSNINSGIATALINDVNIFGKPSFDIGVLEIDERSAARIFPYVKPDFILITNLSRDSVMRNAHPEYIGGLLTTYIPKESTLVLNADDLISANVSPENKRVYFGIEQMDTDRTESHNIINDLSTCPRCHSNLRYEYVRYHHIGKAYCPDCGFCSPAYDYAGKNVDVKGNTVDVEDHEGVCSYKLINESVFNIYNVVSVVALFGAMGYSHDETKALLDKIAIVGSRFNTETINGKTVTMLLAKDRNAYACSRVFDYIKSLPGDKEIMLMMNSLSDAKRWSENICWLYDCDFELLADEHIKNVVITGPRTGDYRLRLLLAGLKDENISATLNELDAPEEFRYFDSDNLFVLYGTDSIALAEKVTEKVKKKIREEK